MGNGVIHLARQMKNENQFKNDVEGIVHNKRAYTVVVMATRDH